MAVERILVMRLGALGDVVIALGPLEAIRRVHPDAHLTVLTRPPYRPLVEASGMADEVMADPTPRPWQAGAVLRLRKALRARRFDRIVDLQGSDRSRAYRALLWPGKHTQVVAHGSHLPPEETSPRHAFDRHAQLLRSAGITEVRRPDLTWLAGDLAELDLPSRFVLLVPGSAPHRPEKRWPASAYGDLGRGYEAEGVVPLVLGTTEEAELARGILARCPSARDLTGRTSFGQIASLGREAVAAIGNDTGPMHILAAVGCPSLVLFSCASDPAASLPLGPSVSFMQATRLEDLSVEAVTAATRDRDLRTRAPGIRLTFPGRS